MVVFTAWLKGSAASSHTRSRSCSLDTTAPCAPRRSSKTANSLGLSDRRAPFLSGDPFGGVEGEVPVGQGRGERRAGAADQCPDAGYQFGELERLGQVVVGAQAEPSDAVVEGACGGEHQHPAVRTLGHQGPADVVAVHAGNVAVEDHHVVGGRGDVVEGVAAVEDDVDGHPGLAEAGRHGHGQLGVVFDHQHPHSLSSYHRWGPHRDQGPDWFWLPRMTDRRLQKRYLVTGLQLPLAYNVAMSPPSNRPSVVPAASTRPPANPRRPGRLRRAGLAAVALLGIVVLATACGGAPSPSSASVSTGSAAYQQALAYAHCMQAHGLTSFPDPKPGANFNVHGALGNPNSPAARASEACGHLLSGTSSGAGSTTKAPARPSSPPAVAADCLSVKQCYAPRQFLAAYAIQPLLDRGITGHGVTVVLPEEAETGTVRPQPISNIGQSVTDIREDLADFDHRFGLPPAHLQVITTLAGSSASPWLAGVEEVEDTELVHAVAPDATIRELLVDRVDVSTPAKFAPTFASYVRSAVSNGEVMSQSGIGQDFNVGESSWTSAEASTVNSALEYAAAHHVTVVVASGDYGAIGNGSSKPLREVSLPASNPWALAAGGTTLTANRATGAYQSETSWNVQSESPDGSGGGFSKLFARPSYQNGVPGIGATRGVPDIAGEATGTSGMALVFSAPSGEEVLIGAGGTSAAAPFWAGLIALADQDAGHPLGFVNPAIYQIAQSAQYEKAFHDITTGNNTVSLNGTTINGYEAAAGWDPVTGWGSPDAQVLIPLLVRDATY